MVKKNKIGRNDPCPCGSGKKYKKCCINKKNSFNKDIIDLIFQGKHALEEQRKSQQGLGRPIISTIHQGYRFVAVGNKLKYSKNWLTFHDFLRSYLVDTFGVDWFQVESKKDISTMHPIVKWAIKLREQLKSNPDDSPVKSTIMSGQGHRYLLLSYNLYLIAHNVELQEKLLQRLKNIQEFPGAYFETVITGIFAKAGFEIKLENEEDPTSTHCEFIAKHIVTKQEFGVEVKNRQLNRKHLIIGTPLFKALRKKSPGKRFIFINLNKETEEDLSNPFYWEDKVKQELQSKELNMTVNGLPAPPAYVFIINFPISESETMSYMPAIHMGFKIEKLGWREPLELREMINLREQHVEYFDLIQSIKTHGNIPSTFDGTLPELEFKGKKQFFVVGKEIEITLENQSIKGILKSACMLESEKRVWCVITQQGKDIMVQVPITEEEWIAYKKNPDYFIAQTENSRKKEDDKYLAFYDFLYETYSQSSKEDLIKFLGISHEEGYKYTQKELAKEFCIKNTYSAIAMSQKKNNDDKLK